MSDWQLANDKVFVGVNRNGGQLGPVKFMTPGGWLEPMHRAPWLGEPGAAGETVLQNLQGDFFCAPFGESDLLSNESRSHGLTSNGEWREVDADASRLQLELVGTVSGARVSKEVSLAAGQPLIYQIHRFEGGEGSLPMGHHAMLRAPEGEQLRLSFSPLAWAGTPSQAVETDPELGRSLLRYPQHISDLTRAVTVTGEEVDLTTYPSLDDHEELVMLVTDPSLEFAWSAAVAPGSGWIWFALRPNNVLRNTMLWLSNGGRNYPPFSGRHRRVIGIEEITAYFHQGHRAALEPNEFTAAGHPTAVELQPRGSVTVRYAFGAVPAPHGFERVADLRLEPDRIVLSDDQGKSVGVPFDGSFLRE